MLDARPTTSCPPWCAPTHCDAREGHADVRHMSVPEVWRPAADDVEVEAAVLQDNDKDGTAVRGVLLRLQNLDDPAARADVLLTAPDLARLERVFETYRELNPES